LRRWETLAALLAVALASLSVVSIGGQKRPALAVAAMALIALVGLGRLRAAAGVRKTRKPMPDAYERALRIQEERDNKFRR
jgi:hypothetical protein